MYDPDTDTFELEFDKPLVLLLGGIGHEGILSRLRTSARQYKTKLLESSVKNWESIIEYFDDYSIEAVVCNLSPRAITLFSLDEFEEVGTNLLAKISSVPNIVFIYEDMLACDLENIYWPFRYERPLNESIKATIEKLTIQNINLMPYKRNAEVTIMAETFLEETEQHLIFRIYVPAGRIWANETDKLLQLFREYLTKVANIQVRLDQFRTDKGIIYEIHSEEMSESTNIVAEFSEFTQFMDLCTTDTNAAENMLKNKNVDPKEVISILSRYSKEAKRLSVDLKHEREQKVLSIRHRLESELVDTIPGEADWSAIESLINATVPQLSGVYGAISVDQESTKCLPRIDNHGRVTINVNPQIIETVNGVVAHEICGDQHIGPEAHQILDLIKQFGGKNSQELASSVHELEDSSAPKPGRLSAKQKIKKFLIGVGSKAGDVGINILQRYIESKLGI